MQEGYVVGTIWINTADDSAFISVDDTASSAIWSSITASSTGGSGDLDSIYANDVDKILVVNDNAGLLIHNTSTGNIEFDLQASGDLTIQDAGVTFATFADDGTITFDNLTLTNTSTFNGAVVFGGEIQGSNPFIFEGATADAFETTFAITDPTSDNTITFQDDSGTVAFTSDITLDEAYNGGSSVTVDTTDVVFNLSASNDFIVQDSGTPFVTFAEDGSITLGKASAASTINVGTGTAADSINIGTGGGSDAIQIGDSTASVSITSSAWSISSSGEASFTTFSGAGLSDCDGQYDKLQWDSTSQTFSCASDLSQYHYFEDTTDDPLADNNTTDYWDGLNPNITPSSASNEILVMVTWSADGNSSGGFFGSQDTVVTVVRRDIGVDPTCSDTIVGSEFGGSSSDDAGQANLSGSAIFVDAPGTTSNVRYTLCSDSDSDGSSAIIRDISFTLFEINNAADLAEVYPTNDATLGMGEVVELDPSMEVGVQRAAGGSYSNKVFGIVSTKPALVIGGTNNEGINGVPIALSGRVPVKVTTENGGIEQGDFLTLSDIPGVAMKATASGYVIGKAMTPLDESAGEGTVMAFVERGYQILADEDDLNTPTDGLSLKGVPAGDLVVATSSDSNTTSSARVISFTEEFESYLSAFVDTQITTLTASYDELIQTGLTTTSLVSTTSQVSTTMRTVLGINELLDGYVRSDALHEHADFADIGQRVGSAEELMDSTASTINDLQQQVISLETRIEALGQATTRTDVSSSTDPSTSTSQAEQQVTTVEVESTETIASILSLTEAEFTGSIKVEKQVTFNQDTLGQARILAGDTEVRIIFEDEYQYQPIVGLTPTGYSALTLDFNYTVVEANTDGFTIQIDEALDEDLMFNWHVFGVDKGKIFVSDGTTEDIEIIVPSAQDVDVAVLGCTDPTAMNYEENATEDDGSCIIAGCTDPLAANYDEDAIFGDNSCVFNESDIIEGCTDELATNYNEQANRDDDSCVYEEDESDVPDTETTTSTIDMTTSTPVDVTTSTQPTSSSEQTQESQPLVEDDDAQENDDQTDAIDEENTANAEAIEENSAQDSQTQEDVDATPEVAPSAGENEQGDEESSALIQETADSAEDAAQEDDQ